MSSMTLFLISLLAGLACLAVSAKITGLVANFINMAGLLLIMFGGYGIFTAFV